MTVNGFRAGAGSLVQPRPGTPGPGHPGNPVRVAFVLDTPNVWQGTAIAGTPARILELGGALERRGVRVRVVLCDRGMTEAESITWALPGVLVHPSVYYGPASGLAAVLEGFAPDLLVVTDAEMIATGGRRLAARAGARLVYEAHDDEASLSASLGEPPPVTARRRRWQAAAVVSADFVTAVTDRDAATMREYGAEDARLVVLPTGCDVRRRTAWGPVPCSRRLLLVGNLHYQPNAQAARIVAAVVETLRGRGLPACARIVGRGPADLFRPGPGVEWRGPVADLDRECRNVSLAVAPLTSGSGMKMKVLTYLAAGLPVLATTEAVAGLAAGHPGVVVCDDLSRWPDAVAEMLADPAALTALGQAGRAYVNRHHAWEKIAEDALGTYRQWLAMPARQARTVPVPEGAAEPLWLAEHVSQDALGAPRLTTPRDPVIELPARRHTASVPGDQDERDAVFGCGPFTVSVRAIPAVLEQLGVYFPRAAPGDRAAGPVARVRARLAPDQVTLRTAGLSGLRHGVASGHPQLAYQVWPDGAGGTTLIPQAGPPHLIAVAAGHGSIEVVAGQAGPLAQTTIRIVRQLMIRHTERDGGLLGHAAAVAAGGTVLLLAGRPGAGKTSVALLLARAGADLCAGDRTLLLPGAGGWGAAELPLAWRIAPGTLHAADLRDQAAALPARARGHGLVDGKHEFTPQELCGLLEAGRVHGGQVAAIVVLGADAAQPARIRQAGNLATALAGTLLRPQDALFTTDWLGLGSLTPLEVAARCAVLAAQVPVYEASWPDHAALPGLADLLAAHLGVRLPGRRR